MAIPLFFFIVFRTHTYHSLVCYHCLAVVFWLSLDFLEHIASACCSLFCFCFTMVILVFLLLSLLSVAITNLHPGSGLMLIITLHHERVYFHCERKFPLPTSSCLSTPTIESSLNNVSATHQDRVSKIAIPVGVSNFGNSAFFRPTSNESGGASQAVSRDRVQGCCNLNTRPLNHQNNSITHLQCSQQQKSITLSLASRPCQLAQVYLSMRLCSRLSTRKPS